MRAQDTYLVEKILSADPVELVRMLYQAALDAVGEARRAIETRDIPARSAAISQAVGILTELAHSLDHEGAPEVSARLAGLYDYMQRCLLRANFEQADAPLAEVLRLLETLAEAWRATPSEGGPVAVPLAWNAQSPEAPAAQGWSF